MQQFKNSMNNPLKKIKEIIIKKTQQWKNKKTKKVCQVGWSCRIHQLLLCRGISSPTPTNVLNYDAKPSDGSSNLRNAEYPVTL